MALSAAIAPGAHCTTNQQLAFIKRPCYRTDRNTLAEYASSVTSE